MFLEKSSPYEHMHSQILHTQSCQTQLMSFLNTLLITISHYEQDDSLAGEQPKPVYQFASVDTPRSKTLLART